MIKNFSFPSLEILRSILSVVFIAMASGGSLRRWLMFPELYMLIGFIFFMAIGSLA